MPTEPAQGIVRRYIKVWDLTEGAGTVVREAKGTPFAPLRLVSLPSYETGLDFDLPCCPNLGQDLLLKELLILRRGQKLPKTSGV